MPGIERSHPLLVEPLDQVRDRVPRPPPRQSGSLGKSRAIGHGEQLLGARYPIGPVAAGG